MTEPPVRRFRRAVIATSRGSLAPHWRALHRLAARIAGAWLARGGGVGVYSHERRELVPGLSDVDLSVIAADEGSARVARARRDRMLRRLAPLGRPVECFHVETRAAVAAACRASVLTHGLDGTAATRSIPMQNRPHLAGETTGWRRVGGLDLRPAGAAWPAAERPGIAWLNLQFWWRHAFRLCLEPAAPWTAFSCAKLVTEPARTLHWLQGEAADGDRRAVLESALERHPGEERAIRHAFALLADLHRDPVPDLALVMGALAHFTRAAAEEIEARAQAAGHVAVALSGDWDPVAPPLLDWRARVKDVSPPRRLERVDGDPARPDDVRAAAREFGSPVSSVLRAGPLAVMPAGAPGEALRGAICPAFDPVTFALLDGRSVAWFPELRGMSAEHCASRAVAEQRLRGHTAALDRAEGFMESVRTGEPELRLETADSHVPIS